MVLGKKIGIWMDHSHAHLTEFATDPIESKLVSSTFTHQEKIHTQNKGENLMHNKEQHEQGAYYKELSEIIRGYDHVLLFGPTSAKDELYNTFKDNPLFKEVSVSIFPADKMTENQEHAYVRDYFSNPKIK
jgi:Lhr-like helicase